jgi:hypothetical protein
MKSVVVIVYQLNEFAEIRIVKNTGGFLPISLTETNKLNRESALRVKAGAERRICGPSQGSGQGREAPPML